MTNMAQSTETPAVVAAKIRAIGRRGLVMHAAHGVAGAALVALVAMVVAMLIDWVVVFFDPALRTVLTFTALALAGGTLIIGGILALARRQRDADVALQIDQAIPALEERWSTVSELAASTDAAEIRGAASLIERVTAEAVEMEHLVIAPKVIAAAPLRRRLTWLFGGACFLLAAAMASTNVGVLARRFLNPQTSISLTQVEATTGSVATPRWEPMTLEATLGGRWTDQGVLLIRQDGMADQQIALEASPDEEVAFTHRINNVEASFDYRIRAGDGQTPWLRVTALDRPTITGVRMRIEPPAYSKLPVVQREDLPRRLKVLAGSRVELAFRCDIALRAMQLRVQRGDTCLALSADDDGWYRFDQTLTESFGFTVEAVSEHELTNRSPPACLISVYPDRAPSVTIVTPAAAISAPPDDTITIEFKAWDDFGIRSAELVVTLDRLAGEPEVRTIPIDLGEQDSDTFVRAEVDLDLAAMGLAHGDSVRYEVRVVDNRQAGSTSGGENVISADADANANAAQDDQDDRDESSRNSAESDDSEGAEGGASSESESSPGEAQPSESSDAPPPNDMETRPVPGGSSCSSSQRIEVDQWAGEHDAKRREKIRIAIDQYLSKLAALLAAAETKATGLRDRAYAEGEPLWGDEESKILREAQDDLAVAVRTTEELKRISADTPYAMIGLQLEDITLSHILPAGEELSKAASLTDNPVGLDAALQAAVHHIHEAQRKLAGLTKQYEQVKRDRKMADDLTRLSKMHQLFIEDMAILLKSCKPTLNPRTGKIVEVDDEFVAELERLAEDYKRMLDELAKLLAEDPEMLRRFMAMQRSGGAALRDQLTLLAQRQQVLYGRTCAWRDADEATRAALKATRLDDYLSEQTELAAKAATIYDNAVVWRPGKADVPPEVLDTLIRQAKDVVLQSARVEVLAGRDRAAGQAADGAEYVRQLLTALDALRATVVEAAAADEDDTNLAIYTSNRLVEVDILGTFQDEWVRKLGLLTAGDYVRASEVDQGALLDETVTLGAKLDARATLLQRHPNPAIGKKATELSRLVYDESYERQNEALEALGGSDVVEGAQTQQRSVDTFARAETVFDELLDLLEAEDGEPGLPPPPKLPMLEHEIKAMEALGAACKKANVLINMDWGRPGAGQMGSAAAAANAQAREAGRQARRLAGELIKRTLPPPPTTPLTREGRVEQDRWDTYVSELRKGLRQGRRIEPPEQYRQAIDAYTRSIAESSVTEFPYGDENEE